MYNLLNYIDNFHDCLLMVDDWLVIQSLNASAFGCLLHRVDTGNNAPKTFRLVLWFSSGAIWSVIIPSVTPDQPLSSNLAVELHVCID